MNKVIAVLATLDTKGTEATFLREQIEALGEKALIIDLGVTGEPAAPADVSREQVAQEGGTPLATVLQDPNRHDAFPVMITGATAITCRLADEGAIHAVIGLGGTQGTSICAQIMQALPYGFPKVMVSTVASGDVSSFVDIRDITMMFSVCDILGLNPITRKILANAAGAACGMARVEVRLEPAHGDRPVIGMTNLGVLTNGAIVALEEFEKRGYEVIMFHAVGAGGRAMEQMMKEGIIGAVFDYGLGEISDELFDGLRAASAERLTVAGGLGLPQVILPGGTEHVGLFVEPDTVPERWRDHQHVFHSPIVLAPRLNGEQMRRVAREITTRLRHTSGKATLILPLAGTSRYSKEGGPLRDPESDQAFFAEIRATLPDGIELLERDTEAEDPELVREAVELLVSMIEAD